MKEVCKNCLCYDGKHRWCCALSGPMSPDNNCYGFIPDELKNKEVTNHD